MRGGMTEEREQELIEIYVSLWMLAEKVNRRGNDGLCIKLKDLFMEEIKYLSWEELEFVDGYITDLGG